MFYFHLITYKLSFVSLGDFGVKMVDFDWCGWFLFLVLSDKTKILKGFFVEVCFFFSLSVSFQWFVLCVSVLISSMQRVFCCCFELLQLFLLRMFLFAVCLCCVLFCFDPFNNHEDKIKGNGNRTLCWVFVLISLSIYSSVFFSSFCIVDLLRFSTRNRIGIPSFNRGFVLCTCY